MRKTSLLLLVCLTLGGCASTPPSVQPTLQLPERALPEACISRCQRLPTLGEDLNGWVADLVEVAGECLRLHETCRTLLNRGP